MTFKNPTKEDAKRFYKEFDSAIGSSKDLLREIIPKYNQGAPVFESLIEFIWHFQNVVWTDGYDFEEGGKD